MIELLVVILLALVIPGLYVGVWLWTEWRLRP